MSTIPPSDSRDHEFIRPGQVRDRIPPPDRCVACGLTEAAHSGRSYTDEAAGQDRFLDEKLAQVRAWEQSGTITAVEAASLRVQYLEHHVETVRNLRTEFFGEDAL